MYSTHYTIGDPGYPGITGQTGLRGERGQKGNPIQSDMILLP